MANDDNWPLPKFFFLVDLGCNVDITFQEVLGLDIEVQSHDYRYTSSAAFFTVKMPGLDEVNKVTMKNGVFAKTNNLSELISNIKMNTIHKQDVLIKLLHEDGNSTMTWTLLNAYPIKIIYAGLGSGNNEIAIESMEIAYEGLRQER